jgi:pimeloyl-ACP methyl ester carboxylesterase
MTSDLQFVAANGIRHRVALSGDGPLILLIHGFPESWYSWRHQIGALATAGYRVAAPDVRGYGGSDKPGAVEAYAIQEMAADVGGLIAALGAEQAIVVGHDWGAAIAYAAAQFHPRQVRAVVGMSVPHLGRGALPRVEVFRRIYKDRFFYQLYFEEPGIAEAELDADVRTALRKIYYSASGDALKKMVTVEDPAGSGWLDRLVDCDVLPSWLTEADLDYYAEQFRQSGFRAPLNRYRNSDRDFAQLDAFDGKRLEQPAAFIAGSLDSVLRMVPGVDMVERMRAQCADLRSVKLTEDAGHWAPEENPAPVNAALLEFLGTL